MVTEETVYAQPHLVTSLDDCYFYHTIEIPGFGLVPGEWDLRSGISDYLGHVDFCGKRVLEVGTASGFVCFHIESLGGDVVSVDLSERESWDIVPHAGGDAAAVLAVRRAHATRINNSFWLCHRAFRSHARMVYSTAYEIPDVIGPVDVAVFGSVLLHMRDPWLAMERAARLTRETIVVTDAAPSSDRELAFLPDPYTHEPVDTWWQFSPAIIVRYLAVLGFYGAVITRHYQRNPAGLMPFFTVVARRGMASGGGNREIQASSRVQAPIPSQPVRQALHRLITNPHILTRLQTADRFVETHLQTAARHTWLQYYRRVRRRIRQILA